jgi:hypothetical protein
LRFPAAWVVRGVPTTESDPTPDDRDAAAADTVDDADDSPGLAATKPLDDPSRGDAEPNEPA